MPKRKTQSTPANFRPIWSCNAVYKIISKIISNRLSTALPTLVSQHQCAFIKGRTVADNALIGLKILHHIVKSKSNPIGF